jgi:hypothetical protein
MQIPIILVKQDNLAVLTAFDGVLGETCARTPHNMRRNWIRCVIDSNGDLWSLAFVRTDHVGIRGVVSFLIRNISTDHYTCVREHDISVGRFRQIIAPHQQGLDPDHAEMAVALFESIATCDPADPLRRHVHLLNL